MKRLALHLETLRCEAAEDDVLDDLLAHDGVIAAELDLERETLNVSYDERRTTKDALMDHLRFFGLVGSRPALAPAA